MKKLTSQLARAHRSLLSLSPARKLLAGTIVAVMIGTGVWVITHSTRAALEPVLDQAFNDADVVQINEYLTSKGVPHEVRDGKVLVPAERKVAVLSDLLYNQVLTGNTSSGFDAWIKQSSLFDSPSKTEKMFNHARDLTLAETIRQFPGVRKATVLVDPTNEHHIGGASIVPTALVDIHTRAGENANRRQLADAAANVVTGAVSTLSRDKVRITIDGASYNVAGEDEFIAGGSDALERRQQCEQIYVAKVRNLLSYIPDVLVSVSVDLNLQSLEEEKRLVDPEKAVHLETRVETRTDQPGDALAVDQEMGVLANAVPEIPEKPAAKPQLSGQSVTTEFYNRASETVQKTRTPAGKETVLSASVAVPRSYFVGIYQRSVARTNAQQAEPSDALLQPIVDAHLGRIRNLVRTSLGLKNDNDVTVEMYEDAAAPVAAATVSAAIATPNRATVLPQMFNFAIQWRQIGYVAAGLAALAVISLVLRRGSGHPPIDDSAPQPLAVSPRVRVAPATLAVSADDSDLLRQVRELAARSPDEAANVLRTWIEQD